MLPSTRLLHEAADAASQAVMDEMSEIFASMFELEPSTLEGYRAMAAAIVDNCWGGEIEPSPYGDERMIARMFSRLTGAPIVEDA
jgi:hypothetical protein